MLHPGDFTFEIERVVRGHGIDLERQSKGGTHLLQIGAEKIPNQQIGLHRCNGQGVDLRRFHSHPVAINDYTGSATGDFRIGRNDLLTDGAALVPQITVQKTMPRIPELPQYLDQGFGPRVLSTDLIAAEHAQQIVPNHREPIRRLSGISPDVPDRARHLNRQKATKVSEGDRHVHANALAAMLT